MSIEPQPLGPDAAVAGLTRSDPHGPGISRRRDGARFRYDDPSGAPVTDAETLLRIKALAIPPAWTNVWISPDPVGHIQATGVDSRGRTQYRYHQLWREQRDAQKFAHMLRFAGALPELRAATVHALRRRNLNRDRVASGVVRLIDLGLFRIGGEKYAELDHHYGATTLEKRHVTVTRGGIRFDYIAKEGKRREITVSDPAVVPTVRALASSDNGLDALFAWERDGTWHPLRATAAPPGTERGRSRVIAASVRGVAEWLGDTPTVARASYIDPRLISRYQADGRLPAIPALPAALPVPAAAEAAVAALLAAQIGAGTAGSAPD